MTTQLWQLSAVDTAQAVREGNVSCVEVVESHLARMAAVNGSINAVTVDLSEAARLEARHADRAVAENKTLGPLHGVPVTVKENVDQAGQATTNGVEAFADLIAEHDSPVVANLKKAGAIIIGRTSTPEFSLRWFTDNKLRGLTRNPWNPTLTPGGSSGGAAASVAMGIAAVAHGNDLGGSLRYPAYCCGLATIRPSLGRVPAYNPSGAERPPTTAMMSVQGPIAREVRDVRLALQAMAARDIRDPLWRAVPLTGEVLETPLRVAVCADPAGDGVDPAVAAAIRQAAEALAKAGYEIEEVTPPTVSEIASNWGAILTTEVSEMMKPVIDEHGSEEALTAIGYMLEVYGTLGFGEYMRAMADRMRLIREWLVFLETYPLALVPVSQEPPAPVNDDLKSLKRMREILTAQKMLVAVNFLGLPAAIVPTGIVDNRPMGVQLIASRYREDLALDAAETIERDTGVLTQQLWSRT
jgi:amidase